MAMPSPSSLQPAHDDEETISYHVISESQITQDHLDACVELCSVSLAYYGEVVENEPPTIQQLREAHLPPNATNVLITATTTTTSHQVGHCFVSTWLHHHQHPNKTSSQPRPIHWITHLITHPSFTSQRIATTLLHHYRDSLSLSPSLSTTTPYIGILTPHPYALLAHLRTFSTGIERLPSRTCYAAHPTSWPHAPLPLETCSEILRYAPLAPLRAVGGVVTGEEKGLSVKTGRRLCGARESEVRVGLERVVWGVNRQRGRPWLWTFGERGEGEEWVCVLEWGEERGELGRVCKGEWKRKRKQGQKQPYSPSTATAAMTATEINYPLLATHLQAHPPSLVLPPQHPLSQPHLQPLAKAHSLRVRHPDIPLTMSAYRFPPSLRAIYSPPTLPCHQALSPLDTTWRDLRVWAAETGNRNRVLGVEVLQAVHFWEMGGEEEEEEEEEEWEEREEGKKEEEEEEVKKDKDIEELDASSLMSKETTEQRGSSPSLFFSEAEDSDAGSGYHPGIKVSKTRRSRLPLRAGSRLQRGKIIRRP